MSSPERLVDFLAEWSEEDHVNRIDDRGHTLAVRFEHPGAVDLGADRARALLEDYGYAVLATKTEDATLILGCVRRAPRPKEVGDPAAEFVDEAGTIGVEQH